MMHAYNRLCVCGAVALGQAGALGQGRVDILAQTSHNVTQAMVEHWMTELPNWGRWGDDDQLGALNHSPLNCSRKAPALLMRRT